MTATGGSWPGRGTLLSWRLTWMRRERRPAMCSRARKATSLAPGGQGVAGVGRGRRATGRRRWVRGPRRSGSRRHGRGSSRSPGDSTRSPTGSRPGGGRGDTGRVERGTTRSSDRPRHRALRSAREGATEQSGRFRRYERAWDSSGSSGLSRALIPAESHQGVPRHCGKRQCA